MRGRSTPIPFRWWTIALCATGLAAGLCGCTATLDVPPGFVRLRDPRPYDLKAVAASGVVLALTARPNADATANLDFWSQAVERQKVDVDGLRLASRESIQSQRGLAGVLFQFELGEGQGKAAYLVALYVTPQRIYTIEAGGMTEAVTPELPKLRQALESLRVP